MPFSVVDARAPLAAAASAGAASGAEVERGIRASASAAAKLSAAGAELLLFRDRRRRQVLRDRRSDDRLRDDGGAGRGHRRLLAHGRARHLRRRHRPGKWRWQTRCQRALQASNPACLSPSSCSSRAARPASASARRRSTRAAAATWPSRRSGGATRGSFGGLRWRRRRRPRVRASTPWRWTRPSCAALSTLSTRTRPPSAKLILNAGVVKLVVRELLPRGFEATYATKPFGGAALFNLRKE